GGATCGTRVRSLVSSLCACFGGGSGGGTGRAAHALAPRRITTPRSPNRAREKERATLIHISRSPTPRQRAARRGTCWEGAAGRVRLEGCGWRAELVGPRGDGRAARGLP